MVWYSHLLKNFPQFIVMHTVKGFVIVNKAEIDVFLELSCFSPDSADVGNLISGSSAFSKTSLNIWKFTVHILLKPGLENFDAKVRSQETPGVTGKFGLGIRNEAGQRLIEFCQENALVITNTLFQQHKRRLYTWTSPDGQHRNQIDYILCSQRWRSSIQSAKTRPFRYDLNQIPYDYTVEVRNRFKGLDLIDRVPDELWMEVRDIVQETRIKTIPMEKKCKKAKWLSGEALQIAVKREAKSKGEKERYKHLNAEFQ